MTSTTLYKRDNKDKIRIWTIELNGDKYRTITGEKDGKLITNEYTIAIPMNVGKANETTGATQAKREVAKAIKDKKDKNYVEDLDEIDNTTYESPMLAESFDKHGSELVYPICSQPKLDGIRANINDKRIISRNGKPIGQSCPHVVAALAPVYTRIKKEYPELGNFDFDGELYNHKFKHDFNKICSLVKRTKPSEEDTASSAALVEYWIYDLKTDSNLSFYERNMLISKYLKGIPSIVVVETTVCDNQANMDIAYIAYMDLGFEGQIIRVPDSKYQFKRTSDLLKRKEFQDGEWEILGVFEGEGNRTGTAGYMTFRTKTGIDFKSNIKGNRAWVTKLLLEKKDLIGKMATIQYFNLTPDGVPRFPFVTSIRDFE